MFSRSPYGDDKSSAARDHACRGCYIDSGGIAVCSTALGCLANRDHHGRRENRQNQGVPAAAAVFLDAEQTPARGRLFQRQQPTARRAADLHLARCNCSGDHDLDPGRCSGGEAAPGTIVVRLRLPGQPGEASAPAGGECLLGNTRSGRQQDATRPQVPNGRLHGGCDRLD